VSLRPGQIPIPFQAGVDTKTDEKAVQSGRLITLENGVFDKGVTIKKRSGYASLSKTVAAGGMEYSGARALTRRDDELVLFTDGAAYSYQASIGSWSPIGSVASAGATDASVAHTGTNQTTPDAATNAGVTAVAWEDSRGGVWWTLVEAAGGRVLRAPAQMDAAGSRPRCVKVGTVLHVVYAGAAGELRVAVINPAAPTETIVPATLTSDLSPTNPSFDALPTNFADGPALIVWARNGGGYRLGYLHQSGVLGSPVTGLDPVVDNPTEPATLGPILAHDGDTQAIVVTYDSAAQATYVATHSVDNELALVADQAVAEGVVIDRLAAAFPDFDAASAIVFREVTSATDRDHLVRVWSVNALTAVETTIHTLRGCGIAARAFRDDGAAHVWLVHDVPFYAVYLCMRVTATHATCVARTLPGTAYGLPPRSHLPSVETDAANQRVHRWCASWQQQRESGGSSPVFAEVGIRRVELDMDPRAAWQTAQLGRSLYIAGACPLIYDGDTITEAGWHYAPDDIATPVQGTGGSLTTSGTYLYVAVYEWTDAQGAVHRGAASVGTDVDLTGGNNRVTLALPTYRHTDKRRVRIGVFRSVAGDSAQLFRVSSLDPSAVGSNGYVASDPTVDTVSFIDDMSDEDLLEQEPLYTNGGIASNDPTGCGTVIAVGKSRLFYTDPSDPLLVRFTHELAEGYGAEFVDENGIPVDPYGGAVTALAVMDDQLIVFKRSAIFAVAGPGPIRARDQDPSSGFSAPRLVTSDVGCTAPASIAVTPVGIVFQSAKGIHMLDRSLGVAYVGAPVEAFNGQRVSRATLVEVAKQVIFLCSTGKTLVLDYNFGQWSTFTNHVGLDAVVIGGVYHYLRSDGRVFVSTPDAYRDDNSQIRLVLETAWIKPGAMLQQYQKVWYALILGERRSAHRLRVRWQTNYDAGWLPYIEFDKRAEPSGAYGEGAYGAGPYGGTPLGLPLLQERIHIGRKCEAIRFRFEDIEDTDDAGPAFELTELLLEVGLKAGTFKSGIPADRSR
jgi:hypothetical protein